MAFITKKRVVLFSLFILPLILYILLSTGINNFAKLPVVKEKVSNISTLENAGDITLNQKISIICFTGFDAKTAKGRLFNINQKIYKPFYGFKDFQMIAVYPKEIEKDIQAIKEDLTVFTDMVGWKFIPASLEEISVFYTSMGVNQDLENFGTQLAFIIDKELNLRGRLEDKDMEDGKLFGYNMNSVAELNNKMKDDVKIVLAEYRLALKKNNAKREI